MQTGARGGILNILTDSQIDRIHSTALDLLQNPGVYSESDQFLDIFDKGGASVDRSARIIRVPTEMVEQSLRLAPRSFVLHGRRDPAKDLLIEPGRVHYGMGGTSEPLFWDYEQWRARPPTWQDMVNCTRVGHALPHLDFVQTLCMSADKPTNHIFFYDFDAIFRNTSKPTVVTILDRPFTTRILQIAAAASGGETCLREQPSVLGIVTPISPPKVTVMNEGVIDAVQAGVPILYSPAPLVGATGPATLAGSVALTMAEALLAWC